MFSLADHARDFIVFSLRYSKLVLIASGSIYRQSVLIRLVLI